MVTKKGDRMSFGNCSDKQVFPQNMIDWLRVVKEVRDGLHRLCGLVFIAERLRDVQNLVFA